MPARTTKHKSPDDTGQEQPTDRKRAAQFKPGQSGNPAGRPKGARCRFSERFIHDFHDAWKEHGQAALNEMAKSKPSEFVKAAASLMPRDINVEKNSSEAFFKILEKISEGDELVIDEQSNDLRTTTPKGRA